MASKLSTYGIMDRGNKLSNKLTNVSFYPDRLTITTVATEAPSLLPVCDLLLRVQVEAGGVTKLEAGRVTAPHQLMVSLIPLVTDTELHTALIEAEEAVLAVPGGDGGELLRDPNTGEMKPLVTVVTLDHII